MHVNGLRTCWRCWTWGEGEKENIQHRTLNTEHRIWNVESFVFIKSLSEAIPLSTLNVGRSMFDVDLLCYKLQFAV